MAIAVESNRSADPWSLQPVLDWLVEQGRLLPELSQLVEALGIRLLEAGAPMWRLGVILHTIHPQLHASTVIWRRDENAHESGREHGVQFTPVYLGSPIQQLAETHQPVRHRLDRLSEVDHAALHQLAAEGGMDYYACPLPLLHGLWPALTLATDRPGGFTEYDLTCFRTLAPYVALVIEGHVNRRLGKTIIETYLGRETGQRILRGLIRRGDGQLIDAVLWFSDLRDFTGLSEQLPAGEVIEMLNAYFGIIGGALGRHGGEILKFIGDGVMAIFPIADTSCMPRAATAAATAAQESLTELARLNAEREREGRVPIQIGIGLHVGIVTFGNIGTEDRFDFTVIGPAVNRCARLESMTKALGQPILSSADFQAVCDRPMRSLGHHLLRGVPEPVEIYTLNPQ